MEFKECREDHELPAVFQVLIESDWNLKAVASVDGVHTRPVLIESDWNLKMACWLWGMMLRFSINRIRLEFKA